MKKYKDEGVESFLMKISQLIYHLQGLGDTISDSEMTIGVLNTLPLEWSSFATNICPRKHSTPFDDLWVQCILEETRIKKKDDIRSYEQSQAFIAKVKKLNKGNVGKSKKKYM